MDWACWGLVGYVAVLGIVSFILVGHDKRAARRGRRRVPERTLRMWAWLGGGLGGLAGMRVFRHKRRKPSFMRPYLVAVVVNHLLLMGLAWFLGCLKW